MEAKAMKQANGQKANRRSSVRYISLIPVIALFLYATAFGQNKNSCVECHSKLEGWLSEPVGLSRGDVHDARGLSCVNCHRGDASKDDMAAAMDRRKGFVGKPHPADIPAMCGSCHSNAAFMKTFNPGLRVTAVTECAR
jgi:hypothetical protein